MPVVEKFAAMSPVLVTVALSTVVTPTGVEIRPPIAIMLPFSNVAVSNPRD